jgi:excinuclease ABC subunit C
VLELDCLREFNLVPGDAANECANDTEFFSSIPTGAAVCLIELRVENAEPLLIRTQDLRRRLQRLLGPPDPASKRLNLRPLARCVRYRLTGSAFEQTLTYYQNAKKIFPHRYRRLLRLRSPAMLKMNLRNPYPRCYVTRRIPSGSARQLAAGAYYGPFASRRSAAAFADRALDFFKARRCQIKIRRDPAFPGCIYSEMKMCLAPCFAGCSKEEYDAEVRRLVQFLDSGGESLRGAFEEERERASASQDFEHAAAVHKKVQKLEEVLRAKPQIVRQVQNLDAVILQRAAENQTIGVFAMRGGCLAEPFFLRFAEMASQPRSAEQVLRDYLEGASAKSDETLRANDAADDADTLASESVHRGDLGEHLSLIARWYYGHPREGEIFFREKDWPYRRILRACSRLLAPKTGEAEPAPPASEPIEPIKSNEGAS